MPSPSPQSVAKLTIGLVQLETGVSILALWKPSSEAANPLYEVTGDSNDPTIYLDYDWKAGPAFLHLEGDQGLKITAVGFLKLETNTPPWPSPEKHTRKGPCGGGGSFHLTADIPQSGADFVEVKNLGDAATFGYRLRVWTKTASGEEQPFDPRVYNHGIIGQRTIGHGGGARSWWQRLVDRLRGQG